MEQPRSSQLLLIFKRYGAIVGAAALTAAAPFNVSAHVHEDNPVSQALMPYKGFVNQMSQMNEDGTASSSGSCCHFKDGIGNIKEETVTENGKTAYYVTFTHNVDGKKLDEPLRFRVPDKAVLTDRFAIQFCRKLKTDVEAGRLTDSASIEDAKTCNRPPINVSWISGISKNPTTGKYQVDNFYCYIPKPRSF